MLSGHVVGGGPFWVLSTRQIFLSRFFPRRAISGAGSLLDLNSDVPSSGSRRFCLGKAVAAFNGLSHKDRIQVLAPTSFQSALHQLGQSGSLACLIRSLATRSFPVFLEER